MPSISYTTNIPPSTDNPSTSQPTLQSNCNSVASIVNVDMIGFNDVTNNSGYHSKITFVDQTSSPPGTVAGADVEYAKTVGSFLEIFLQRPSGSAIQLTSGAAAAGSVSATAGFQTFLPGGLQIKFGKATTDGSGNITFATQGLSNFPTAGLGAIVQNAAFPTTAVSSISQSAITTTASGISNVFYIAWGN